MRVHAFQSTDWPEVAKNGLTQKQAISAVEHALSGAKKLLPTLSENLNIVIRPHWRGIIPEYGVGGHTYDSEFIEITIDKTIPYGVDKMLESIQQTVFHESNHAARWHTVKYDERFISAVPFEGLATVFEREYAGYQPLYGQYGDDKTMRKWFAELQAADWKDYDDMFFRHTDGRRWIGYKTGTWLIDRAINNSGKTIIELTLLSADDIVNLANVKE